jgi:PKD repeat protein
LAEGEVKSFVTQVVPHAQSNFSFTANELQVSFVNLSTATDAYQWNFGDNTFSTDTNPTPENYSTGGTYEVTLVAANNLCADTFSASFQIDSCPVADITYQLNNHNAFFYTPVTNTGSYFWNFGDGDSAAVSSPNVFHQYPLNGEYHITLTVQNQLGCKEIDTLTITVDVATGVKEINDELIIRCDGLGCIVQTDGNATIEVFDVSGRKINEKSFTSHYTLPATNFSSGIYLAKITRSNGWVVKKFIVE